MAGPDIPDGCESAEVPPSAAKRCRGPASDVSGNRFFALEEGCADPQETPRFRRGPKQCARFVGFLG